MISALKRKDKIPSSISFRRSTGLPLSRSRKVMAPVKPMRSFGQWAINSCQWGKSWRQNVDLVWLEIWLHCWVAGQTPLHMPGSRWSNGHELDDLEEQSLGPSGADQFLAWKNHGVGLRSSLRYKVDRSKLTPGKPTDVGDVSFIFVWPTAEAISTLDVAFYSLLGLSVVMIPKKPMFSKLLPALFSKPPTSSLSHLRPGWSLYFFNRSHRLPAATPSASWATLSTPSGTSLHFPRWWVAHGSPRPTRSHQAFHPIDEWRSFHNKQSRDWKQWVLPSE